MGLSRFAGLFVMTRAAALLVCACTASPEDEPAAKSPAGRESFEHLPRGEEQLANLCARTGEDDVRDAFCDHMPEVYSLYDLQRTLGLDSESVTKLREIKTGGVTAISLASHSTSLSKHNVSAINPRLVEARARFPSFQMVVLAFNRGDQEVELLSRDRVTGELNFYLVSFRQACNDAKNGCSHADLFTSAIERDWTMMSLYDETDLQNTVHDCATCHQPNGPGSNKQIIMQEFNAPFTHWFSQDSEGGQALLEDYLAAHENDAYGGMESEQVRVTDPTLLPTLILARDGGYKGTFDSVRIEHEIKQNSGGGQPHDNRIPGESQTWRAAYEQNMLGSPLTLPYHDVKVTDPEKLSAVTEALQAFSRGELPEDELPQVNDVFPDDPQLLAELGIGTEPGSTGESVLLQACSQCHREPLDPTLSRARFRADLKGMSRAEKDLAIERMRLDPSHPLAMPPARARTLTKEARERAIKALMR
jgi:mono/diheme cytochrome c family protein